MRQVPRRQNISQVQCSAAAIVIEDVVIVEDLMLRILAPSGLHLQTTATIGMAIAKLDKARRLSVWGVFRAFLGSGRYVRMANVARASKNFYRC